MATLGSILSVIGIVILFVGGVMFLIAAFKESILWGLGCFFLSFPVSLIFLVMHWDEAKKPFFIEVVGAVIMVLGMVLGGLGGSGV